MVDKLSKEARSRVMAAVHGKDTGLERHVRSTLFASGFRFRLHRKDLPGCPDLVFPRFRLAVFIHGCFWHGHGCPKGRRPASNQAFWAAKLDANIKRDAENRAQLERAGWTVVIMWGCEIEAATQRLLTFLTALHAAQELKRSGSKALTKYPAKKHAKRGGTALPIIRAIGSI